MQPAALEMSQFLSSVTLNKFSGKIVANVDAKIHTDSTYSKEILVKQIASAVLWTQSLSTICEELPKTTLVEAGPGKVLQGLAKKTIESINCLGAGDYTSLKAVIEAFS